jgi:exodeoxyribonuclease V beta subunit
MQSTANEIVQFGADITLQQQTYAEFEEYHHVWQDKGLAPMLNLLIQRRGLAAKWLGQRSGERQLTNLRHLIELLQQESLATPGMHHLVKWISQEQQITLSTSSEERQLRLESDENLVKIVTMHASKGLEYDVVMIPMPIFGKPRNRDKQPALFHEERQGAFVASVEFGDDKDHRNSSLQEAAEEDMRLLYVAMTRARYRCYIGLPKHRDFAASAFAKLLKINELTKTDSLINKVKESLPPDLFEIVDGNHPAEASFVQPEIVNELVAPPPRPTTTSLWRIHSYTGVVARLGHTDQEVIVSGFSDDDTSGDTRDSSTESGQPVFSKYSFPRGARVGVALHSLMEEIDFADASEHESLCLRTLNRLGLADTWMPTLMGWLSEILASPLEPGISLSGIDRADRLDEMEFHFPLSASTELLQFLKTHHFINDASATQLRLEGLMTGLIDLTFRHDGRYYIVDYKSNYLGTQQSDYHPSKLDAAMRAHQYHLQYMIYTVALHRMLLRKLPGYEFEKHFGGVHYLYLRGMNSGDNNGIYSARPALSIVSELDTLLGGKQ